MGSNPLPPSWAYSPPPLPIPLVQSHIPSRGSQCPPDAVPQAPPTCCLADNYMEETVLPCPNHVPYGLWVFAPSVSSTQNAHTLVLCQIPDNMVPPPGSPLCLPPSPRLS